MSLKAREFKDQSSRYTTYDVLQRSCKAWATRSDRSKMISCEGSALRSKTPFPAKAVWSTYARDPQSKIVLVTIPKTGEGLLQESLRNGDIALYAGRTEVVAELGIHEDRW
jgi:hypothetical protein